MSVGDAVKVGAPYVAGAKTEAKVMGDGRGEKEDHLQISSKDPRTEEERTQAGIYRMQIMKI